ncbi:MAG: NusA-like transcription termination signal-binding factor [Thermofilaceae archaeon]|nr:NusA-like transcription termination signal-binding factor [Thermofilaceae archaeon]MCX8181077.1 NusA-like transcription termination signal-binding factor [Thermofilaceae archaeon]MDW8004558.1 NusA-like transcription termination signal-binding factor [Thermofilaceae archaeon]
MSGIKLTESELQLISLFEAVTQVEALDCILDDESNRLIFVVRRGSAGKAIGSNGANAKMLRKLLKRDVEIVEEGATLEDLIRSALFPASIKGISVSEGGNGNKVALVEVSAEHKGLAIGKGGRNIKRAKLLAKRYFNTDVILK